MRYPALDFTILELCLTQSWNRQIVGPFNMVCKKCGFIIRVALIPIRYIHFWLCQRIMTVAVREVTRSNNSKCTQKQKYKTTLWSRNRNHNAPNRSMIALLKNTSCHNCVSRQSYLEWKSRILSLLNYKQLFLIKAGKEMWSLLHEKKNK